MRDSDQRLRRALEIETVGAIYFDMTGRFTDANDAFLDQCGYSRADLERGLLSWQRLTPPEWIEPSQRAFAELKATGRTTPYEKQYFRKDGSRWWGLFAAKLLDRDTGFEFVLDITARKVAEQELQTLNTELAARVARAVAERSEAEAALRQAQKMEAIGQITGSLAHDFNNLLTVIRSSADLLRRDNVPDDRRRHYADAIADTADRAARLTAQLLAFSRRQALNPVVFDAAERIAATNEMLRTALGPRVELDIRRLCDNGLVEVDQGQFDAALVNLAINARDAMDGEGRLTITLEEADSLPPIREQPAANGSFLGIALADTGKGILPDDIPRIFEPFFTTKPAGKGTGLGLSQVYGFARQSRGEVDIASVPGHGTTVTLYLPRATVSAERSVANAPAIRSDLCGRVLVVEDDEQVGAFAVQLLEDLGYQVSLATNAAAALDALTRGGNFDVVFSDVVMPGMSGVDLARRIRRDRPGLPVVLTSGYSEVLATDSQHGFPLLHKPYSMRALSDTLQRAIDSGR